jgi:hypothetical protein
MPVTEMNPELVWRLVEGYPNELTPAFKAREALYRQFQCPRCKGPLEKEFDARVCCSEDELLPKALLRCRNCNYCIDPHTHMIVNFGDASKIPVEFSPLILQDQHE